MFNAAVAWGDSVEMRGVVLDYSDKPVQGAELFLYGTPQTKRPADYISPKTGVDGRFRLMVPMGNYWGVARVRHSDKYGPLLAGDMFSGEPVEISAGVLTGELVFKVADIREVSRDREKTTTGFATLSGRVVNSNDKPAGSVAVYLWSEPLTDRLPDIISSWTGRDGEYSLEVPPGNYLVLASAEFPPALRKENMVRLAVSESQKYVALNLQLSKMEKDSSNDAEGAGGSRLPHDDE